MLYINCNSVDNNRLTIAYRSEQDDIYHIIKIIKKTNF